MYYRGRLAFVSLSRRSVSLLPFSLIALALSAFAVEIVNDDSEGNGADLDEVGRRCILLDPS